MTEKTTEEIVEEVELQEKEEKENSFQRTVKEILGIAQDVIYQPIDMTRQAYEAVQIMRLMQREAGDFVYIFDSVFDPSDLNESLVKVELGIAYLKRADATDRVELIDDIIRELKQTRKIAKRMDTRDEEKENEECVEVLN